MKLCGIYLITHTETGRKYVGQSRDIHCRWRYHSRGRTNTKIGCAILKHGWHAFTTAILELCDIVALNESEMRWVKFHNCVAPHGFNLTTGGSLQCEYSAETRTKIGAANSRRVFTDEMRARMSASKQNTSPETRARMSAAQMGKTLSPAHALALLNSAKRYAHINIPLLAAFNTGKKNSPETIAKRAASITGQKRSAETCARISASKKGKSLSAVQLAAIKKVCAANIGRKNSPEHIAAVAAALRGRKHTPEHTAKIVAAKASARLLRLTLDALI